jgi:hypothetical protein
VVANSYSQLVSGLERQLLSVLLDLPSQEQLSEPQPASRAPAALPGKWSGQILTYERPINVTLNIGSDGSAQAQVGDRPSSIITNVSLEPSHFYGQLRAEPGLPDSFSRPFMIELELTPRAGKLVGAATFGPLPGEGDGDQLPHFMNLARAEP